MHLKELVEEINKLLVSHYGIDTISSQPIWRVVWSEDQFEKQLRHSTEAGIQLLTPVVMEVPKYRQWIKEKHILERLTIVPEINQDEIQSKLSYEPIWVFEDKHGNALPPKFIVCKFVIDSVYAVTGHGGVGDTEVKQGSMRKYVDDLANEPEEVKEARINQLVADIWGNESDVTDALSAKEGIVVPTTYPQGD